VQVRVLSGGHITFNNIKAMPINKKTTTNMVISQKFAVF
jgi:hypothetical protein